MAKAMAATGYRVLLHDRRNCGASDVAFDGSASEHEVWADDLHALAQGREPRQSGRQHVIARRDRRELKPASAVRTMPASAIGLAAPFHNPTRGLITGSRGRSLYNSGWSA